MTLTFELNLDSVKMNQHARYPGQWFNSSKVNVRTPTDTYIIPTVVLGQLSSLPWSVIIRSSLDSRGEPLLRVAWWLSGRALDLRFTGRGSIPGRWLSRNIGQLSLASLRSR